jgi:hypothetical protein
MGARGAYRPETAASGAGVHDNDIKRRVGWLMRWVGWRPARAETANQRSPQDEEQTIIPARTLPQALAIADELYAVRHLSSVL